MFIITAAKNEGGIISDIINEIKLLLGDFEINF